MPKLVVCMSCGKELRHHPVSIRGGRIALAIAPHDCDDESEARAAALTPTRVQVVESQEERPARQQSKFPFLEQLTKSTSEVETILTDRRPRKVDRIVESTAPVSIRELFLNQVPDQPAANSGREYDNNLDDSEDDGVEMEG